jgi:YidC/Oxa1 family membrane protein insertase
MTDSQRMVAAVGISLSILLGFNYFFDTTPKVQPSELQKTASSTVVANDHIIEETQKKFQPRSVVIKEQQRVTIQNDHVRGSINLVGGRLDDLDLTDYKASTEPDSPPVNLLSPCQCEEGYWVDASWSHSQEKTSNEAIILPNENTHWAIKKNDPRSIRLQWDNGKGLIFERIFTLDDHYVVDIEETVINNTHQPLTLIHQATINRFRSKKQSSSSLVDDGPVHNGGVGYIDNSLMEMKYDDKEMGNTPGTWFKKGWFGFTDKFWLVSFIPDQTSMLQKRYDKKVLSDDLIRYQAMLNTKPMNVGAKENVSYHYRVFAGGKVLKLLDEYEQKLNIEHFDLAVDFGWFYFITKPVFYVLTFLNKMLGNLGLAIIFLTILFKVASFPLTQKMARSQKKMRDLAPKIEKLKKQFGNDQVKFWQAQRELMQKEKVSPFGGCLPAIIQAPIFFCLYKVLFISIEMRHAPFLGWIKDLSAPDTTNIFTLFGWLTWHPPSLLHLGIGPIILGLTMWYQQRLSPQSLEPAQAKAMLIMPVVFTFLFASFPMGLVLYWTVSNVLSIIQQWLNNRTTSNDEASKKTS